MTVETAHIHVETWVNEVHGQWRVWIVVHRAGAHLDYGPLGIGRSYRKALGQANRQLCRRLRDLPIEQWSTRREAQALREEFDKLFFGRTRAPSGNQMRLL